MTVSGLPMTSAVRHPIHTRDTTTQSQRSAFASCKRERTHEQRVRRSETSTDTVALKRIRRRLQHQLLQ